MKARGGTPRIALVLFGPPGQGGFNGAGLRGFERAAGSGLFTAEVAWEAEPSRRVERIAEAARSADLVVAHGGQGEAGVASVAPLFPDVAFAVTQGRIAGPNIACFEVLQEHSAFLAGALAGWWSDAGIVAHLSGEPVPPGLRARAAFAAGLRHARPDARLLSGFCGDQHDPARAAHWTLAQARAGARVQFAMLDGGRPGALEACREAGMRAIGNVRDWTAEDTLFLASAIADNGVAVEAACEAFLQGRFEGRRIGAEVPGAVRLAVAADVEAGLRAQLDALAQRIAAGALDVPEDEAVEAWQPS